MKLDPSLKVLSNLMSRPLLFSMNMPHVTPSDPFLQYFLSNLTLPINFPLSLTLSSYFLQKKDS